MSNDSNSFDGFGNLDLSGMGYYDDGDTLETPVAIPAHAKLVIEDKYQPLFLTADWTLVATVGDVEVGRSSPSPHAHSDAFIKRWARQLIRSNKDRLRQLGVDVSAAYLSWGGALDDLSN